MSAGNGFNVRETITQHHTYTHNRHTKKRAKIIQMHSIGCTFDAIDFIPNMGKIYLLFNYNIDRCLCVEVFD